MGALRDTCEWGERRGLGAGGTHAGRHVPPRGRQQLQGRAGAGKQLGPPQTAQHGLGVGDGPGHQAQPRARLRGPGGSDTGPAPGPSFPPRTPRAGRVPPRAKEQLRGHRLGVYSSCATRVLRLLARAPETPARPDSRTGRATGPFACAGCVPNHSALPRREMHSALPFPSAAPRRGAQPALGSNRASPRVPVKLSERQRWPRARWAARHCAVRGLYPPWGQCQL